SPGRFNSLRRQRGHSNNCAIESIEIDARQTRDRWRDFRSLSLLQIVAQFFGGLGKWMLGSPNFHCRGTLRARPSQASGKILKEYKGRDKIMEHEVRLALYNIKCLGRPASDPQCSAKLEAIDVEKAAFQPEYSRHTPCLTGRGFLYLSPHLSPKNRSGLLLIF